MNKIIKTIRNAYGITHVTVHYPDTKTKLLHLVKYTVTPYLVIIAFVLLSALPNAL